MSTLKTDSIQPVTNSNNLIFKTGAADAERMRIQTTGKFVINNARADVGLGTALTGQNALGTIHLVQNTTNDNWVGMTTSATTAATTSQGGILIQGSDNYGTKIHFLTTDSYYEGQKNRMTLDHLGRLGIGTTTPGASLDVNGTLKVGDFGGTTNVMVKLNNTATAVSSPAVGCVIPLLADTTGNTTPLPPGTWFVYLNAVENSSAGDEDTILVMAKIWTVSSGTYLRFSPTNVNPGTVNDIGLSYSIDNNTSTNRGGTFTAMKDTDAYFTSTVQYPLATIMPSAGTHRGIVAAPSNSPVVQVNGFAIRIA